MDQPEVSPGWQANPNYVIDFDLIPAKVTVFYNGEIVAESREARVLYELGHAPTYYLPRRDLKARFYSASERKTFCPYKGVASYLNLQVGSARQENAVWFYEAPYPEVDGMEGYAGFYWGKMSRWEEDGKAVAGPREIPNRIDTSRQLKACFPELASEWHPTKNLGRSPYEFAADSNQEVWWQDQSGREWKERIKDRVVAATKLRADGDATPYG